jgi:hypothetical protein
MDTVDMLIRDATRIAESYDPLRGAASQLTYIRPQIKRLHFNTLHFSYRNTEQNAAV